MANMTKNEAIKIIKEKVCNNRCIPQLCDDGCMYGTEKCAFSMAIQALEQNTKRSDASDIKREIEKHEHWLKADCDGWENMKIDLHGIDLHNVDLSKTDLRRADFYDAFLINANLYGANLYRANLRYADLSGSNLSNADLSYVDLCGADLRGANLRGANLHGADLCGAGLWNAILCDADLSDANLRGVDLSDADLHGANLVDADLYRANLYRAKNLPFIPYICPDFGSFIGYTKPCDDYIVELEIPENARRVSGTSRRCRCDKAKVLRILNIDRTEAGILEVEDKYDNSFIYRVGEIVSAVIFDDYRWSECLEYGAGIYFFINFQEAVNYNM